MDTPVEIVRAGRLMAFTDFWRNVRRASGLLPAPDVDADTTGAHSRDRAHWLTVRAVAGYDAAELSFLPAAARDRLTTLVDDYRKEFAGLGRRNPAPPEVVARASVLLREVVGLLDFEHYEDADAYRLGKQIEAELEPDWPETLQELYFKTGPGFTGEPLLRILVILKDDAAVTDDQFLKNAGKLRPWIREVAQEAAPDLWPHLSFRSYTDNRELVAKT